MARRVTLDFLKTASGAGLVLAAAAALAVALANSPWASRYAGLLATPIPVRLGDFAQVRSLSSWVADGLMPLFFLVVGMEIKFEFLRGELSSPRRLALPILAALGGMVVPALIYLGLNLGPGGDPRGWPAVTATDIAFSLAVLAVAAPRMPSSLRVFLLTLAIADDLGAVGLIALLFTARIHAAAAGGALAALAALALLARWRRAPFLFYAAGFVVVWAFTLQSGLNTSLAGIACAIMVPVGARRTGQESVLKFFIDSLHPYVAYGILPLFAFTAAGFSLQALTPGAVLAPLPLGLIAALVVGKPLGVFGFSGLAAVARLGRRPAGTTWLELLGVALICGVGFTLSFFIGGLAFAGAGAVTQDQLRLGVVVGSLISALAGAALLARAQATRLARGDEAD